MPSGRQTRDENQPLAEKLNEALNVVLEHTEDAGDGTWLETMVAAIATDLAHWQIEEIWKWGEWPDRQSVLGESSRSVDDGIDLVARRRDGGWVALQCKAKGEQRSVTKDDVRNFLNAVDSSIWAERWIITNTEISDHVFQKTMTLRDPGRRVRSINIGREIREAIEALPGTKDAQPDPRSKMQAKAVEETLKGLESCRGAKHPGWKEDEARGQTIMPCGTGKTRVGYAVAKALAPNLLTIVMVPSIGLVRQLQIQWQKLASEDGISLQTLSVCSDRTVMNTSKRRAGEENRVEKDLVDDPTVDLSEINASDLTGDIASGQDEIERWLKIYVSESSQHAEWPVIFSTYQSGHHTAQALRNAGERAEILILDEAHRTAGLKSKGKKGERQIRDFTVCHRGDEMPAKTRLYMTATPRSFVRGVLQENSKYDVVTMDDEATFGPECYRLSYREAVECGFLSDYRIVAIAPPDDAYEEADRIARESREQHGEESATRSSPSLAIRKLAYAIAICGGIPNDGPEGPVNIRSSIAFCNRIAHSRDLAVELGHDDARAYVREAVIAAGGEPLDYEVMHRDAGDNATRREEALASLRNATDKSPVGVTNVGIFGEGIDTPALDAIAFIEARKSPVDVIQAVGRAMRLNDAKSFGYILVPLEIPPGCDAEAWLESRENDDGYRELGQILNALRAHDGRIEHKLADLMQIYVPDDTDNRDHLVTMRTGDGVQSVIVRGPNGIVENSLSMQNGESNAIELFEAVASNVMQVDAGMTVRVPTASTYIVDARDNRRLRLAPIAVERVWKVDEKTGDYRLEPVIELSEQKLIDATLGVEKIRTPPLRPPQPRRGKRRDKHTPKQKKFRLLTELGDNSDRARTLQVRILENSGLQSGTSRDFNILYQSVSQAAHLLTADQLETPLAEVLHMNRLAKPPKGKHRADACTVTALLLMTAVMVQARLEAVGGSATERAPSLSAIMKDTYPTERLMEAFDEILDHDFRPVFKIARDLLRHLTRVVRKTANVDAAIRGIVRDARDIAETYATMGMDYAGELFNRVMGDQASDGAYFTRPVAAVMLAELALEATGEKNWNSSETLESLTMFDPACGSGTLLMAYLSGIKRRVRAGGGSDAKLRGVHRVLVEEILTGLDINPVSLQLAGGQLTIGEPSVEYQRMSLWEMPYGPGNNRNRVKAGSLELLGDSRILMRGPQIPQKDLHLPQRMIESKQIEIDKPDGGVNRVRDDIVERVSRARVVLTNPPFVTRKDLGSKYGEEAQKQIRKRIDALQTRLEETIPQWEGFCEGQTTRPLYVLLGLLSLDPDAGVLGTIMPTAALLAPSGLRERQVLGQEFHIRWIVTCHEPRNTHLSQSTINESLVVGTRKREDRIAPTAFISTDRFPRTSQEAQAFAKAIAAGKGDIPYGRRIEVTAERMARGDWSAAGWRSLELDEAAQWIDACPLLIPMGDIDGVTISAPGHGGTQPCESRVSDLHMYHAKGQGGQNRLLGQPDTAVRVKRNANHSDARHRERVEGLLQRWDDYRSSFLITAGQDTASAMVNAVTDTSIKGGLGTTWKPVQGINLQTAKAWTVYSNSTLGRIELMRYRGKKLSYPFYRPRGLSMVHMPDPEQQNVIEQLAHCWSVTHRKKVDRYDQGQTAVRNMWDETVSEALGMDRERLRNYAELLNSEPAVSEKAFRRTL